ncbi:hypothetical protein PACILC2_22540 [Paenibacillus cisolokensis]|uniref:DNA (cytosine-5-)-methyltransferase n=1 Tax=Paenibacillus cisolokensis TaxID=1658519 RepID=A0ABQ4N6C9_9BACL|nr:DNA cytosine methyltransferase [Paenibacillus cisolokensis]GIQ63686.1 hypothetical protein PACILC2_22540 [Paenibacillus cisolokensis]
MSFKYIELFAGIGGFRSAFDPLGGECVFASEIDKYAQKAYRALYNGAPELHGDITKIDAHDIPDHDVLVGGFPCFPAGQKVITAKGFVNIENIRKGDVVLTHTGNYREVITPMMKLYNGDLYEITAKYYRIPIKTTSEHPFWTKRGWVAARDLTVDDYVGFPLNKTSELPKQFTYTKAINQSTSETVLSSLPFESRDFWKLIGYWLAEGWTQDTRVRPQGVRNAYRVIMAANDAKLAYISNVLDVLNIPYTVVQERTCKKVHITNVELWIFIKQFTKGNTASDKCIPESVQNLPVELADALIDGYFNGDGCTNAGYRQFTSTSRCLLEGVQRLLLKTERRLYSLTLNNAAGTAVIEGRKVTTKDSYILRAGQSQGHCVEFTDDYVFFKIDRITKSPVQNLPVYNFEVAVDNSYCLPMIAVHNCQAFSVAGQRKGFEDTRGTLFSRLHESQALNSRA